jgi:hypothetical protein
VIQPKVSYFIPGSSGHNRRWRVVKVSLYIEGPLAESLAAYRLAIKTDFVPVLSYPAFSVMENSDWTAV